MRYVVVRRTALSLGATLLSGAALFAWLVSPRAVESSVAATPTAVSSPSPPNGAALFRSHCGSCHSTGSLQLDRSRSDLEAFLRDHGDASEADDRVILDFIASQSPSAAR